MPVAVALEDDLVSRFHGIFFVEVGQVLLGCRVQVFWGVSVDEFVCHHVTRAMCGTGSRRKVNLHRNVESVRF